MSLELDTVLGQSQTTDTLVKHIIAECRDAISQEIVERVILVVSSALTDLEIKPVFNVTLPEIDIPEVNIPQSSITVPVPEVVNEIDVDISSLSTQLQRIENILSLLLQTIQRPVIRTVTRDSYGRIESITESRGTK